MKLGSLKHGRDGKLIIISHDLRWAVAVPEIAMNLQSVIDDWDALYPKLQAVSHLLNAGKLANTFSFDPEQAHAPLPRAYQWCEGSAYLVHLERTRRSTNRDLPPSLYTDPGVWQGVSNYFLPPNDPIPIFDDEWDIDLEPSIGVITDDVPMGTLASQASTYIKLVVLLNDLSLRAIQIPEMKKGLGIIQGKPLKTFAPIAVTPESLGEMWQANMLACAVNVKVNGELIGNALANVDYNFDFPTLIEYVAKTRDIGAGTIISCGTVANRDEKRGNSCLMEKRAVEILGTGQASTPYLKFGDQIQIECLDSDGISVFGAMSHSITKAQKTG
jgi:fumarylacetoacetate (FAA) hydrolase